MSTPNGPDRLWDLLPKAFSSIISLSALGYFVGWKETQAYYISIGAGWAATSIAPQMLLQKSANTILAIASGAFFCLVILSDTKISFRKVDWFCVLLLLASAACLFSSQGMFGEMKSTHAYALASIGSMLCAVAAGITVSEFYVQTRAATTSLSSGHLWLIYWIVLPGLFWAPERLGQAQSLRDMDSENSPLPIASTASSQSGEKWRLVQILGDKALLVKLHQLEAQRQFKVVAIEDLSSIGAASNGAPK